MNFNAQQFGRRIKAWHVIERLLKMRDTKYYWTSDLKTVNFAIELECREEIPGLWGLVEA